MVGTHLILASNLIQSKFYLVLIYKMKTKRKDKRQEKYLIWIICLGQVSQPKHKSFWIHILGLMKFFMFSPRHIEKSGKSPWGNDVGNTLNIRSCHTNRTKDVNANANLSIHICCKEPDLWPSPLSEQDVWASVGRKCQYHLLLEPAGLFWGMRVIYQDRWENRVESNF